MRSFCTAPAFAALLFLLLGSTARADPCESPGWRQRIGAIVQSALGIGRAADWEVIEPPANIDRQMAMTPSALGTMQIIRPPRDGLRR